MQVNGETIETQARTLQELLAELGLEGRRCATVLNGRVIHRPDREQTPVGPGDEVEIISMVGGG